MHKLYPFLQDADSDDNYFVDDEIGHVVFIEADSIEEANEVASIGVGIEFNKSYNLDLDHTPWVPLDEVDEQSVVHVANTEADTIQEMFDVFLVRNYLWRGPVCMHAYTKDGEHRTFRTEDAWEYRQEVRKKQVAQYDKEGKFLWAAFASRFDDEVSVMKVYPHPLTNKFYAEDGNHGVDGLGHGLHGTTITFASASKKDVDVFVHEAKTYFNQVREAIDGVQTNNTVLRRLFLLSLYKR